MSSFIDRYTHTLSEYLDSPDLFIRASGYHIISTLLGRFFWIPPNPGLYPRANVWFILSSIPGLMRRSALQGYDGYICEKVLYEYLKKTRSKLEHSEINERISHSLIEEGTPEGIMDHLSDTELSTWEYDIVSTEFGSVLKRMGGRTYEAGVSSLFSKLYYGEGGSMYLSKRGGGKPRYIPRGLYVTMFAGMQEPEYYITPMMVRQGLIRRILICFVKPNELKRWNEPLNLFRKDILPSFDPYIEELIDKMIKYNSIKPIDTHYHPRVMDKINEVARKNDEALKEKTDDVTIYKQGFWEQLAKLSVLEALSRDGVTILGDKKVLFVNENDLSKAKKFLDKATKHSEDIITGLGAVAEPLRTAERPLERVYRLIVSAGKEGIYRKDLLTKSKMSSRELNTWIETLIGRGNITVYIGKTSSKGGPVPTIYKIASI